jgi:hypothetical protein
MKIGYCDFILVAGGSWNHGNTTFGFYCKTHMIGQLKEDGLHIEKATTEKCEHNIQILLQALSSAIEQEVNI